MGAGWDVTETKQLLQKQAELIAIKKQQKEQCEFMDSICHEIRNPLNGIIGYLDELKLVSQSLNTIETKDDTIVQNQCQLQSSIEVIEQCSMHQRSVIDQMLQISTLESGNVILSKESFSVESEIESVVEMCKPIIKKKLLKPILRFPAQPIYVLSDKTHFKQSLVNLVSNAVNNSPESAEFKIHLSLVQCTETIHHKK
jgi:signal transduction histidine kinase